MSPKRTKTYTLKQVCSIFSQAAWAPQLIYALDPIQIENWFLRQIWRVVILLRRPIAFISPQDASWYAFFKKEKLERIVKANLILKKRWKELEQAIPDPLDKVLVSKKNKKGLK